MGNEEVKQISSSVKRSWIEKELWHASQLIASGMGALEGKALFRGQPARSRITPGTGLGYGKRTSYIHIFSKSSCGFCTFKSRISLNGQVLVSKGAEEIYYLIQETQAVYI